MTSEFSEGEAPFDRDGAPGAHVSIEGCLVIGNLNVQDLGQVPI